MFLGCWAWRGHIFGPLHCRAMLREASAMSDSANRMPGLWNPPKWHIILWKQQTSVCIEWICTVQILLELGEPVRFTVYRDFRTSGAFRGVCRAGFHCYSSSYVDGLSLFVSSDEIWRKESWDSFSQEFEPWSSELWPAEVLAFFIHQTTVPISLWPHPQHSW